MRRAAKLPRPMRLRFAFLLFSLLLIFAPCAARAEMADMPVVKLQSLDKVTARTMTFEVRVGSTVKFGPIYIKVQACRKAPPIEQPESASFLQIWEVTSKNESKWIYSGWMFASSPALSAMDHPIYDVWVLDCLDRKSTDPAAPKVEIKKSSSVTVDNGDGTQEVIDLDGDETPIEAKPVTDGEVTGEEAKPPETAPPSDVKPTDLPVTPTAPAKAE